MQEALDELFEETQRNERRKREQAETLMVSVIRPWLLRGTQTRTLTFKLVVPP